MAAVETTTPQTVKATAKFVRVSARKARLVADTIRGRSGSAHWALLIVSTLAISPVPYLITGWLSALADKAAAALLLVA